MAFSKPLCKFLTLLVVFSSLSAKANDTVAKPSVIKGTHFAAKVFAPTSQTETTPIIIVLGGSSGGMRENHAQTLADNGFIGVALAYFRYPGLPDTLDNIPVASVSDAIDKLATQYDSAQFGILGISRGTELAFLAAINDERINAVAAVVPTNVAWHGQRESSAWKLNGAPVFGLSFERRSQKPIFERASEALLNDDLVTKAQFPVEKITGNILLLSASADRTWPSSAMSEDMLKYLQSKGFKYSVSHRVLDTGHRFNEEAMGEAYLLIAEHFKLTLTR